MPTPTTYRQERWDLSTIIPEPGSKAYHAYYQKLLHDVKEFTTYRNKLTPTISTEQFKKILQLLETIEEQASRINNYTYLKYSENTSNQEARKFKEQVNEQLTELSNQTMFFTIWIKSLDEKNLQRIKKTLTPDHHYFLEELRLQKPYTLNEAEEKIINYKDTTGVDAMKQLYNLITNSFTYTLTINNKKKTMTREELGTYVRSDQATLRKHAYDTLYATYTHHQEVLGDIYKNIAKNWETETQTIRKYPTSIHPRHLANNIDETAVHTMLQVIRNNNETFQDYFKLKAKIIHMKKLRRYDIYAPLHYKEKNYTWNKAVHLVLDSYQQFSPLMADHAKKILNEHHVDSVINQGKKDGAYCMDIVPGITPYVLINYTGKMRDVQTLAHELGHGIHDILNHKHSGLVSHPPLILAETASIFGEMIVAEKLLGEATPEEKIPLLADNLDDLYASIPRQAYFVLFEQQAHKLIRQGTTTDELNKTYLKNQQEHFGTSIELPSIFQQEWLTIPHTYEKPYYCYAYSFGQLLTLALYQRYKQEGPSFVKDYLRFLSHGGSKKPQTIATELGIDFNNKHFWQQGYKHIQTLVHELKKEL